MDVTRDNFAEALAQFKAAIGGCDFVALDMEMTGLFESREQQPNSRVDSRDERYAKLRRSVEAYMVVQVGICLFTWVQDGDAGFYEARPFAFNVFPGSSAGGAAMDVHFGCKSSALEFLARSSFDFNKWVYQGVRYLRADDAARIRRERAGVLADRGQPPVSAAGKDGEFVRGFELALAAFVASAEASMRYDTANSYQRKLIYGIVSGHDTLGARGRVGHIEVFKGSRKALDSHRAHKIKALDRSLEEARGFCAVIDLLSAARKPVVGHNMPLDVLHAYDKFLRPLPATRAEFERGLQTFLPVLVDTKHIIESTPAIKTRYGTSNLDEIAPMLAAAAPDHPQIRFHPRFTRNVSHTMHEAGYDAYMTGASLIRLLSLDGALSLSANHAGELVLYRYINKLYLASTEGTFWKVG
ncbi:hypothetical protein LPJ61_000775 [Coemansia biformis]|uniref:Uncharacterized protein n=1 Tax=Coemansia biformis TaxID=1286918 RepID=A0A9W7YG42_9FUNG|nr:hypothetical protein LPJ61_000775 [Coemansia biformis]